MADPEIWKVEQTEDNISAPMLFIANAYSDLYVFCMGKRSPAEKIVRPVGEVAAPLLNLLLAGVYNVDLWICGSYNM